MARFKKRCIEVGCNEITVNNYSKFCEKHSKTYSLKQIHSNNPKGVNKYTKVEILPPALTDDEKRLKLRQMYREWVKLSNEAKSYIARALHKKKQYETMNKEFVGITEEDERGA